MSGWKAGGTDEKVYGYSLELGADGRSACIWCYRLRESAKGAQPVDRYRRKEPEDEGPIEFVASPACVDLP